MYFTTAKCAQRKQNIMCRNETNTKSKKIEPKPIEKAQLFTK